jgi:hypothetical protein
MASRNPLNPIIVAFLVLPAVMAGIVDRNSDHPPSVSSGAPAPGAQRPSHPFSFFRARTGDCFDNDAALAGAVVAATAADPSRPLLRPFVRLLDGNEGRDNDNDNSNSNNSDGHPCVDRGRGGMQQQQQQLGVPRPSRSSDRRLTGGRSPPSSPPPSAGGGGKPERSCRVHRPETVAFSRRSPRTPAAAVVAASKAWKDAERQQEASQREIILVASWL